MDKDEQYFRRELAAMQAFTPSTPISRASLFAGRAGQIRQGIAIVFERGQHGIIFGERGVGKTSLANCMADFIPNPSELPDVEPAFLTPRVNCTADSSYDSVWREVFGKIEITERVRQMGFRGEKMENLLNLAELAPKRLGPGDVQELLTLAASQKGLIVVIDEIDTLKRGNSRTLMAHTIKALSDHSVGVTLFLVGVGDTIDELILEHQSIARCLGQISMPRMHAEEINELVNAGIARFNDQSEDYKLKAQDDALAMIAILSRGIPSYAHRLAQQACCFTIGANAHEVERVHVAQGMREALQGVQQSILSAYQKAITTSHKSLYCEVLTAAAVTSTDPLGYFAPADLRIALSGIMGRRMDIPAFMPHLLALCTEARGKVLQRAGEPRRYRFRFTESLMQPYAIIRAVGDGKLDMEKLMRQEATAN